ncbi:MAG: SsrA-binding protein SmpB [Candidatus Paceibacterota bacterium]
MRVFNRKFKREYEPLEKFEAGIVLTGPEVKSMKAGRCKLEGAYVKLVDEGVLLVNAEVAPYAFARQEGYDPKRSRKLLLNKREIRRLAGKLSAGGNLTIVPIACYNRRGKVKVEIALAKGRKTWQKRKVEKNRAEKRRVEKEIKEALKR